MSPGLSVSVIGFIKRKSEGCNMVTDSLIPGIHLLLGPKETIMSNLILFRNLNFTVLGGKRFHQKCLFTKYFFFVKKYMIIYRSFHQSCNLSIIESILKTINFIIIYQSSFSSPHASSVSSLIIHPYLLQSLNKFIHTYFNL